MTVLLIHGEPAAVIAPYGHKRRPGATAEIAFDQTAPPEARLVLKDTWGGSIRMSTGEFRQLARAGVSPRFEAMRRSRNPHRRCPGAGRQGRGELPVRGVRRDGRRGQGRPGGSPGRHGTAPGTATPEPGRDRGRLLRRDRLETRRGCGLSGRARDPRRRGARPRRAAADGLGAGTFYCLDCAQNYCCADWRTYVLFDDGFYGCTMGRCPRGHEHMIDEPSCIAGPSSWRHRRSGR